MTGFLILLKSVELSAGSIQTSFLLQVISKYLWFLLLFVYCTLLCLSFALWKSTYENGIGIHTLLITPSEPFSLTCLLLLSIMPAGIVSPNMFKHTALWQKLLFISLWAVPSVAFAGWQHLKGVWYQPSCEGGLWESRPIAVWAAQGVGSGLLRKGELWKCCIWLILCVPL